MYHIILSGTGPRYVSFIGSITYLFEKIENLNETQYANTDLKSFKYYKNIKTLCGSSGGSLIAMGLSIGYTMKDMKNIGIKLGFNDVNDLDITEFIWNYGIDSGLKYENMLKALVKFKYGNSNLTFKKLYEFTGIKLVINAISLNKYEMHYFDYINTPDLELWKAVRMSSSVPFLFKPFKYNNNIYVDGALGDFFPIHMIKSQINNDNDKIIGIRLGEDKKTNYNVEINNFLDFSTALIMSMSTMLYNLREDYQIDYNKYRNIDIISFNTAHIGGLSFDIDENDREILYNIGYSMTKEYFDKKFEDINKFCYSYLQNIIDEAIANISKKENNNNQQSLNPSNNDL